MTRMNDGFSSVAGKGTTHIQSDIATKMKTGVKCTKFNSSLITFHLELRNLTFTIHLLVTIHNA